MSKGLLRSVRKNKEVVRLGGEVLGRWTTHFDQTHTPEEPKVIPRQEWVPMDIRSDRIVRDGRFDGEDPMYENGSILGKNGRAILISLQFIWARDSKRCRSIRIGFDIGGSFGIILENDFILDYWNKEGYVTHTWFGYTLDTWEANGGVPMIYAHQDLLLHSMSIRVARG